MDAYQVSVEVARIARDLLAHPIRFLKGLVFTLQFYFSDDESRILTEELVDLPGEAIEPDLVAFLLDQRAFSQGIEHRVAFCNRISYSYSMRVALTGGTLDRQISLVADPSGSERSAP